MLFLLCTRNNEARSARIYSLEAASREQGRDLQTSNVAEVAARNTEMREDPGASIARYDWAWGYDVEKELDQG